MDFTIFFLFCHAGQTPLMTTTSAPAFLITHPGLTESYKAPKWSGAQQTAQREGEGEREEKEEYKKKEKKPWPAPWRGCPLNPAANVPPAPPPTSSLRTQPLHSPLFVVGRERRDGTPKTRPLLPPESWSTGQVRRARWGDGD